MRAENPPPDLQKLVEQYGQSEVEFKQDRDAIKRVRLDQTRRNARFRFVNGSELRVAKFQMPGRTGQCPRV
jgi:hypothetical protein